MRQSFGIGTAGWEGPPGLPVSLTELRSGTLVGYYPNVVAAEEHRRVLESAAYIGDDADDDPDDDDPDDGDDEDDLPDWMVEPDEERAMSIDLWGSDFGAARRGHTDGGVVSALQEVLATPGLTAADRARLEQLIEINQRAHRYHPYRARAAAHGALVEAKAIVTTTLDQLHRIKE